MKPMFDWLEQMAKWLVYDVFGMNPEDRLAKALDFFIYDSIKILLLLFTVVSKELCIVTAR